ncbi:unnamed protein product [Allacma fusca]|uniref:DUF5641 domain-containing protein n=1 Tax=Allacma fusca TaxID=39272 RepID=A0A8J2KBC8_9HEXA|nr:unnamed protein product [Allacma fusca]
MRPKRLTQLVAPRKKETIPRLELCGAALLSKVVDTAEKFLKRDISGIHLWTDSTIVLAWLANPTSWKIFVSHRITDIVKNYPRSHWHHVKSGDNPADPASRGTLPNDLQDLPIWWNGPSWSKETNFNFAEEIQPSLPNPMPEVRKVKALFTTSDFLILERYSSLIWLLRVVAMCLRISPERKTPVPGQEFSVSELFTSLQRCISLSQREAFSPEIQALQGNLTLNKRSKILPLSPFLDSIGLLRMPSRWSPTSSLQPPITLLDSSWTSNCQQFRKEMHNLLPPESRHPYTEDGRVNPGRLFSKTGVDFAGPFNIKRSMGPRNKQVLKGYVCVFVCFTTHSIHLEAVSDLTTASFLSCPKRFVSRRGLCSEIFSDCGSNFVGADRELRRDLEFLRTTDGVTEVTKSLSSQGVKWHFNPTSSPHFGGLWESGVRLFKGHMKRVIGATTLNFEEFTTILTQIEACINSRPITPLSSDPNDLSALTPGHFVVGEPLNSIPEPDLTDLKITRLSRWQHCQQMLQHLWRRWHREYLHTSKMGNNYRECQYRDNGSHQG